MIKRIRGFLFFQPLISHRQLVLSLSVREIETRNANTYLGWLWGFLGPLIQIAMYTFVFAFVFNVRWSTDAQASTTTSALKIFLGMTIFNLFAECIGQSPMLVLSRVAFVKKVVFPLEILSYVTLFTALRNFAINLILFILCYAIFIGTPHVTSLFMLLLLVPLVLTALGIMWFVASLTIFLRDMRNVVPIAITILMFMSPIFYPASMLENRYGWLLEFNFIGWIVEECRKVAFDGAMPNFVHLTLLIVFTSAIASLGYFWFMKTKKGFADVL